MSTFSFLNQLFSIPVHLPRVVELDTPKGVITVRRTCPASEIETLKIDETLGFFWHHRIEMLQQALMKVASQPHGYVTVAYTSERVIVGYVTISVPSEDVRWGRDHIEGLLELGGIEVARDWRRMHLADAMLKSTFANEFFDRSIVIATGYRWCWDYEESGLTVNEYRDCLHRLFQHYGFQLLETDEPNIAWYPDNALVGRIGRNAPSSLVTMFKGVLFERLGAEYASSEFIR